MKLVLKLKADRYNFTQIGDMLNISRQAACALHKRALAWRDSKKR